MWFLSELLPSLPADFLGILKHITMIVFDGTIGVIVKVSKMFINFIGNFIIKGFFGWDNAPDPNNPEKDKQSDYFRSTCNGKKCYAAPDGTVPFPVIIATILCPPVGTFMEFGLTGWFQILICSLLTLMFYFPGLIYALILIYC
jgi:uncharacterized membrane protein YqaE (UPF0057 family)